jgi:Transglutaminase-like superfamily
MARVARLLRGHSPHLLYVALLCLGLAAPARAASPTLVPQPGVTAPASIAELARALKNDVNLIYEYVYTNIDYSPTYGLKKGALGTLLDGRGNDFDQAALMVVLLRQAGYTASYVYGKIRLSPAQLTNWLGVNTSNPCTVGTLLSQGGIPFTLNVSGPLDCTGTLVSADIAHVWVSVTGGSLGTTTYVYEPSFKTNTTPTTGINLAAARSYSQSSFLATAESGYTLTSNSIQNLNTANLQSALTGYANNLVSYIKTNMPTATLKDVVGGRYIQPLIQPYTPQTSLPYETPGDVPQTWTGDVPNQYRTTLEIKIGGIDQTYFADQIYGHRLSLVYNATSQPVLYLDGVVQGTGAANATTVTYNVDFPFPANIFTFQNVLQATAGYSYAIVNGWDFSGRGMVEFHRRQLQANQAAGSSAGAEPVLGEALNMIGYAWLAQLSALADLQDHIIGSKVVTHCAVGVVGQVAGPYIDMPGIMVGYSSLTSDTNRATTAFFGYGGHVSAFEWGTLDQNLLQGNISAVSTIKLLDIANSQNVILYDATMMRRQATGRPSNRS